MESHYTGDFCCWPNAKCWRTVKSSVYRVPAQPRGSGKPLQLAVDNAPGTILGTAPNRQPCSLSDGSPFLSAISRATFAISLRTSYTTASILRRTARSLEQRAAMPLRCVRTTPHKGVDQLINVNLAHQFALLFHQTQLQHLGLDLDVISVGLTGGDCCRSRRKYRR
jgi:hypothetical protein